MGASYQQLRIGFSKRQLTRNQTKENHSQRKEIASRIERAPGKLLWRHVSGGTQYVVAAARAGPGLRQGQAKINHLDVTVRHFKPQVGGLYIAVNQSRSMNSSKS